MHVFVKSCPKSVVVVKNMEGIDAQKKNGSKTKKEIKSFKKGLQNLLFRKKNLDPFNIENCTSSISKLIQNRPISP